MDGLELKTKFDGLQELFNRCINHAFRVLTDRITAKSAYLDCEQMRELEKLEYIRTADELAQLYLRYSVLSNIRNFYSDPAFLWNSTLFEELNSGEKKKYLAFSVVSFDYSRYEQANTVYDAELPYFSAVVKAVVLERYAAYLQDRKSKVAAQKEPKEVVMTTKAVLPIAETDNPFDSTLNDEQIAFLVEGINDVKMFNVPLTPDDLTAIFAGKPHAIVRSNNNRLVAFFFAGLSDRGLITPNWQSVIANYKLFLSKDRSRDKVIYQLQPTISAI